MPAFKPARTVTMLGWLVTIAAFVFMAQVFWAIDRRSHSVTDTFYAVYPFWGVTLLLWDRLARGLSGRHECMAARDTRGAVIR